MNNIKNIIFDLGGVLLDIDFQKSFASFEALGVRNIQQMYGQHHASELFKDLETGKINEEDFYEKIMQYIPGPVSREQVEGAWNAMLGGFRIESLAFLQDLSKKYRLFLLSNTNSIHLKKVQQILMQDTGKPSLDGYFTKAWYSHLVGLRKPDTAMYEFVLADAGIQAEESFFIDDTIENIQPARELGMRAHLLLPHEGIEGILE